MDGVLVINKPKGITSHDVVVRARRALGIRRIGHVGTLDPLATGVLPLVVGRATRLASLLSVGPKNYKAVIQLGIATDTYDVTGSPVSRTLDKSILAVEVDLTMIEAARQDFTGTFQQQPPPFSAKKIRGTRAYKLARREQSVSLPPATVTVHYFEIQSLQRERLSCRVSCSPGFYMRALAHDLGQRLGCGGCLESLHREQSGTFTLDHACGLSELEDGRYQTKEYLIRMEALLPELPAVMVTQRGAERVSHGNTLTLADIDSSAGLPQTAEAQNIKVYDAHGMLMAIAEKDVHDSLHPRIVLV